MTSQKFPLSAFAFIMKEWNFHRYFNSEILLADLSSLDIPAEFRPRSHSSSALHRRARSTAQSGTNKLRLVSCTYSLEALKFSTHSNSNQGQKIASMQLFSIDIEKKTIRKIVYEVDWRWNDDEVVSQWTSPISNHTRWSVLSEGSEQLLIFSLFKSRKCHNLEMKLSRIDRHAHLILLQHLRHII